MPYGRPPIRRRIPRHGFTSQGYVENLPERERVPVNWEKMRNTYIPQGIMTLLGAQLGGAGGAMTGYSASPIILQMLREYGLLNQ
jgi:hypothetical protein